MRNLVPIGRFSRLCRLTIPALRLYDELGLLKPAAVDPDTGYRYYSLAQAREAERIRVLRSMDMPLEEIRALLSERDPGAVRSRLERHGRELQARIATYQGAVAHLERLVSEETGAMDYSVETRETAAQPIASIRTRTSLVELPAFMGSAYGEIFQAIGQQGVRPAGPPFVMYHDPEFKEDDIDLEAGVPVSDPVEPTGRVVSSTLPAGTIACTLHLGPYEGIGAAYGAVTAWVQEHGREFAGPPREVYLVGVGQAEAAAYRTEVQFPVR
jgi:effector-binding domain-containing protein